MPADPMILERIRGCPFARGGRVLVRFRANGYSLVARRSGVPLARLRLTGEGDDVVLLYPSHRGWAPPCVRVIMGISHWAIVASLVATAKLNGVDPLAWLADVLERLLPWASGRPGGSRPPLPPEHHRGRTAPTYGRFIANFLQLV